jgi:hypothetical protein
LIAIGGDRTILVNIFARRGSPRTDGITISSFSEIPSAEVVALFADDSPPGELPHTVIVDTSTIREFFAWAATYLAHWSPITSAVRVLNRTELSAFLFVRPDTRRFSVEVSRALSSLIIGEALCEWKLAGENSSPSLLSLRSTFGYAAVEALLRKRLDVEVLCGAWERAQRILNLRRRRIERRSLLNVWRPIVTCLTGNNGAREGAGPLGEALTEMISEMRLPLRRLPIGAPLFARYEANSTNERREDAVVDLQKWLAQRHSNSPIDRFYTACLGARLSQSAITHFDVIAGMTSVDPESLLWYSFVSGLLASEPSAQSVERLLFRLSNEFGGDAQNRRGDISLDELEVLIQPDGLVPPWVGIGAGYVTVELDWGVLACFRVTDRGSVSAARERVPLGRDRDAQGFEDLLQQLRTLYQRKGEPLQRKRRRKEGQ